VIVQSDTTTPEAALPKTICLVDDDPWVLIAVGRLLTSAGWVVQSFSEPATFLVYVSAHNVDLVILDIWMNRMTGLEVLAHLCSLSPQTRIIIITGREDLAAKSIATQVGAVAFFVKPFDDKEFLNAVHYALAPGAPHETKV
jgi:FixJ family two-component response regulator